MGQIKNKIPQILYQTIFFNVYISNNDYNFFLCIFQLFINNEWVKSSDGKTFKTENPANGQVIAEVQEAGKADVDKAVKAAKDAFKYEPIKNKIDFLV